MSKELKPCHRCGTPAEEREDSYGNRVAYCPLTRCSFFDQQYYVEEWNTRPIEDALHAELAKMKADGDKAWKACFNDLCKVAENLGLDISDFGTPLILAEIAHKDAEIERLKKLVQAWEVGDLFYCMPT